MEKSKRNYRKEYDNYHASPEQRERNAARLRARRLMVKRGKTLYVMLFKKQFNPFFEPLELIFF